MIRVKYARSQDEVLRSGLTGGHDSEPPGSIPGFSMPNYAYLAAAISPALARSSASFSLRFSATSLMMVD
jgi:hypothetical protein